MKKLLLLSTILAGTLFSSTPTFSGIELKQINGSTGFSQIEAGEAIQIKLNNINEGGKTDTKRKVFASLNGIKGQGLFGVMTKDSYLWQAPKVSGTYTLGAYVENTDGSSSIVSQDIIVKTPYVATSGRNNCPINFVFVPNSQGLHGEANGWCIMKYEASPYSSYSGILQSSGNTVSYFSAKAGSESATSKPKNPVYYKGSLENAKERCSSIKDSNGNSYSNGSLVSIDVWTNLVKDLYNVSYNWTEGSVTGGNLYIGHTNNDPAYPIIPSDLDTDGYYLTNDISSDKDIINSSQKRTMKTSYNDVIWDITGNVKEYFRENYDNNAASGDFSSFYLFQNGMVVGNSGISLVKINNSLGPIEDPKLLNNYKKLLAINILGFKPNVISNNYVLVAGGTNLSAPTTLIGSVINYKLKTDYTSSTSFYYGLISTPTNLFNADNFRSNTFLQELGIGGYSSPNITGNLGYNIGLGNPITYGGDFSQIALTIKQVYGTKSSFLSNTGLLTVNSGTDYTNETVIASNTTSANVGFRCMIPATN